MFKQQGKQIADLPREHRDDRAFAWPAGSVRAAISLILVGGMVAGAMLGYWRDGIEGAAALSALLGAPAGTAIGFYFMQRNNPAK